MAEELPDETVREAERLTRLAREAVDDAEAETYRDERAELLGAHGFLARVREDDAGATLVLYPGEWVERVPGDDRQGGSGRRVRTDRIDDTDRAVEVLLSGPGDPEEWAAVDEHNREVAARVRAAHGDVHGDNATAFADFMSNHYARPVESATREEVEEFLGEYFPRNAWPSDEQRAVVEESVEFAFELAGE